MSQLFKKKNEDEMRSKRREIRLTTKEDEQICHAANIRNLDVAEFIRRAALGRKADVSYESKIVLQLSDAVRAIRAIHKSMVELNFEPPEEIWSPVMDELMAAMLRIDV